MRKTSKIKLSVIILSLCLCVTAYAAVKCLRSFTFDEDKSLDKWSSMILSGEVEYTLIKAGDDGYVKASSKNACSALYHRVGFKLKDYPTLSWKWRVTEFPDVSMAETEEEKDDYAARIYIIFPFLTFSSSQFLEYVWSEDIPAGTIVDSPFADNVKIIVVRSGRTSDGEWVSESRNAYEDYLKAFGRPPKRKARAIAIMCDADSTNTSAESFFDNITIESQ